MGDKQNSK